jgi:septum formation inhibitor-activating ATPase MinD
MSCAEIVEDSRVRYKAVNCVQKSIKVTSKVVRESRQPAHGLLLTARQADGKKFPWKGKQSVYIREIKR